MSEIETFTTTWIETPLSKFGFKCVSSKHDFCVDSLCECLCHHVKKLRNISHTRSGFSAKGACPAS